VTVRSVIPSVSRITHDRGNGRRPNMVGKRCTVTFFTSTNITQIRLSTMYFDSTGGATALLQLCSRGIQHNAGALEEFKLSERIFFALARA